MQRREFLSLAAAGALRGAPPRKPNIIFILADDLGYGDLGSYGQRHIRTPNIDRLAAEGTRFEQCYAGATVCAPSRSCLMTGQHTGHTTVRANHSVRTRQRVPLNAEDVTVAELLKQAGYATGIIGKWGLGEPDTPGIPNRQGFDEWFGYLNQDHAADYYTDYLWRNEQRETLRGNLDGARGAYTHDLFAQDALRFVKAHRNHPFFLYLAYTIPHAEHVVPSDAPYTDQAWTQKQKNYAAMVTRMDKDIGELMTLLRTSGLDENTLVFFTSDNGAGFTDGLELFGSAGPFRGRKGDVYEGGHRVPMIARWPGRIRAGAVNRQQVWAFWDFLPTAADIAGVKPPQGIDGISVLPALLGQPQKQQHEFLYWEGHTRSAFQQAVRMGSWKGVRAGLNGPLELYDLNADVAETRNIAAAHPGIVKKMEDYLRSARSEAVEYPTVRPQRKTPQAKGRQA